jgi:hypothetical protein
MLLVLILSSIEGAYQPTKQNRGLNELIRKQNADPGLFFHKNHQMQ